MAIGGLSFDLDAAHFGELLANTIFNVRYDALDSAS